MSTRASAAVSFGGDDRLVSEYMESEFLSRISRRHRAFLTRTAVLERMSRPLCEAVLELSGSAVTLAELARSNLLLVPPDRRGETPPQSELGVSLHLGGVLPYRNGERGIGPGRYRRLPSRTR